MAINIIITNNLRKHKFPSIHECKKKLAQHAAYNILNIFINLKNHTEQNLYLQGCFLEVLSHRINNKNK